MSTIESDDEFVITSMVERYKLENNEKNRQYVRDIQELQKKRHSIDYSILDIVRIAPDNVPNPKTQGFKLLAYYFTGLNKWTYVDGAKKILGVNSHENSIFSHSLRKNYWLFEDCSPNSSNNLFSKMIDGKLCRKLVGYSYNIALYKKKSQVSLVERKKYIQELYKIDADFREYINKCRAHFKNFEVNLDRLVFDHISSGRSCIKKGIEPFVLTRDMMFLGKWIEHFQIIPSYLNIRRREKCKKCEYFEKHKECDKNCILLDFYKYKMGTVMKQPKSRWATLHKWNINLDR